MVVLPCIGFDLVENFSFLAAFFARDVKNRDYRVQLDPKIAKQAKLVLEDRE